MTSAKMLSSAVMPSVARDDRELLSREMRLLHVREYHRMIEAGIFEEDERVELIQGVIVGVSPQNPHHAIVVERLNDPLSLRLPAAFIIRCQLPLPLPDTDA